VLPTSRHRSPACHVGRVSHVGAGQRATGGSPTTDDGGSVELPLVSSRTSASAAPGVPAQPPATVRALALPVIPSSGVPQSHTVRVPLHLDRPHHACAAEKQASPSSFDPSARRWSTFHLRHHRLLDSRRSRRRFRRFLRPRPASAATGISPAATVARSRPLLPSVTAPIQCRSSRLRHLGIEDSCDPGAVTSTT